MTNLLAHERISQVGQKQNLKKINNNNNFLKNRHTHAYTSTLMYKDFSLDKPLKYLAYDKEGQGYWKGNPEVRAFGVEKTIVIL